MRKALPPQLSSILAFPLFLLQSLPSQLSLFFFNNYEQHYLHPRTNLWNIPPSHWFPPSISNLRSWYSPDTRINLKTEVNIINISFCLLFHILDLMFSFFHILFNFGVSAHLQMPFPTAINLIKENQHETLALVIKSDYFYFTI
jgi:hypothetical protein